MKTVTVVIRYTLWVLLAIVFLPVVVLAFVYTMFDNSWNNSRFAAKEKMPELVDWIRGE